MVRISAAKSDEYTLEQAMTSAVVSSELEMLEVLLENSSQDLIGRVIVKAASAQNLAAAEILAQKCSRDSLSNILVGGVLGGRVELLLNKVGANFGHITETCHRIWRYENCKSTVECFAERNGQVEVVKLLRKRASITQDDPANVANPTPCKRLM
ncbi:hypothetical protein GQ600_22725 [Phytophthora cactorum]|nr:hypothetical protein GQ600_22725 [Phytophthora cactorum]